MSVKSYERALLLKEKGNTCYRKRNSYDALNCYAEAIHHAPWPISEQRKRAEHTPHAPLSPDSGNLTNCNEDLLAICFGNRSAVLHEIGNYQDCLLDIELALKFGAPPSSQDKLHKRKQKCIEQLQKELSKRVADKPALTNAFESKYVSVKSRPACGRYIEATTNIPAGEVVVTEEPFAALLDSQFKLTHCSFCFNETAALVPCCWCTTESYCSEECLDRAWTSYHWVECERVSKLKSMGTLSQLCLRTAIQSHAGNCQTVFSLLAHEDKYSDDSQKTILEEMAQTLVTLFGRFINHSSLSPKELFLHHLLQLRCNTHTVSTVLTDRSDHSLAKHQMTVEKMSEAKLGSVLYSTLSLVNHACKPNAILRFVGNRASLCVTRLISAGEEVNISYGPQLGRNSHAQRQAELKKKYFFECACTACGDSSLEVQDALLCPTCSTGPLTNSLQSEMILSCSKCNYKPREEELTEREKTRSRARHMYTRAVEQDSINLPCLVECQLLQKEVLYKYNMELAKTNDTLAKAYAMQGDFLRSSHYCELSCQAVGVAYGNDSIELGNELVKLTQLFLNSFNTEDALKTAEKARSIIKTHHGSLHPDCLEIEQLIKTLTN